MPDIQRLLALVPLFHDIAPEELNHLWPHCQERRFQTGEPLLRQGEPGEGLLLLTSGMVAVKVRTFSGDERVVVHLGPGQILGEIALLDGGPHSATVVAVQPTEAVFIPRAHFWEFCARHQPTGVKLLRNLAADMAFKLRHVDMSVV